jgi:hypothetical protein
VPTIRHFREYRFIDEQNEFRCPECVSGEHDGDFFCSLCKCPEQIPQPKFPSPTSSFLPEEFAEVVECIERGNRILLTLGVKRDAENLREMQESFRTLRNHHFAVTIDCGDEQEPETIKGHLVDSGLDFIIIQTNVGNIVMIPFERISQMERLLKEKMESPPDQELLKIDACLRRALTFHFGQIVPKSPFLINLFFGLELKYFLESYVNSFIYVKSENDKFEQDGILENVNRRNLIIEVDDEKKGIDLDKLCYIEIERTLLAREYLLCNQNPIVL